MLSVSEDTSSLAIKPQNTNKIDALFCGSDKYLLPLSAKMAFSFKQTYEVIVDNAIQSTEVSVCPMFQPVDGTPLGPFSCKEPFCLQLEDESLLVWTAEYVKRLFPDKRTVHIWWNLERIPQKLASNQFQGAVCSWNSGVLETRLNDNIYISHPASPVPKEDLLPCDRIHLLHYCLEEEEHDAWNWHAPWHFTTTNPAQMCQCAYGNWCSTVVEEHNCHGCGAVVKATMTQMQEADHYCSRRCQEESEYPDDFVSCQGCGTPMDPESHSEYRAGYWCSRACAYDIYSRDY